ncbi:MAG: anthranilate phosphoribosyltransferase [Planctomycetota bacterium]|jgi:anthranilate phosphoribosyltransferase
MICEVLDKLLVSVDLSEEDSFAAMDEIMGGSATPAQVAAYLVALRCKGESTSELAGSLRSMRRHMHKVDTGRTDAIDICGTGGDSQGTFNISTTSAFVVAGAGVKVAKHGNRAASSLCGSADLLEELGVDVAMKPEQVTKCIEHAGIGFMFAPFFHPAMKNVAPVRKELGVRTIFNMLGPLANPAGVKRQLVGVFHPDLLEKFALVLGELGAESVMVVHGNGYDEATTTGPNELISLNGGSMRYFILEPEDLGFSRTTPESLLGGTAAENAAITFDILAGNEGPQSDTVILNSALALYVAGVTEDLPEGVEMARESIISGKAMEALQNLIELSRPLRSAVS